MRVDAFQYDLPAELIAQRPAERRELARLMVLPRDGGTPEHRSVADLPELLPAGTLVVVNDTRVLPARLLGRKRDTGGRVEVLLVRRMGRIELDLGNGQVRGAEVWRALGKGNKPLRPGTDIDVGERGQPESGPARLHVRLVGRAEEDGLLEVALWTPSGERVDAALRACGHVPLPPYIKREDQEADADRYQTVYARQDGAIAAPTAGLHLTNALLGRLAVRGCEVASVTLHVGLGTFQPVTADDLDAHPMHSERYTVSRSTAEAIAGAKGREAPVLAVGTTTVRALESAALLPDPSAPATLPADGRELGGGAAAVRATTGETRLLIQPGHVFRAVDALLTNFHLPRSTLLALVCAFGGTERVLDAYRVAVSERYRFFSYGDAMLLWRAA